MNSNLHTLWQFIHHEVPQFCLSVLTWLALQSCQPLAENEHVTGNYYLVGADSEEQMQLTYHTEENGDNYLGIAEPTVYGVGYDKNYIIVKQHPRSANCL